ncbi:MAG: Rad3-related DNA helicase [Halonotius sp. J07HN6]|nr:MAG: Rad3-related DNA helicase [Halonotius sp. J07HN6]
MNPARIVEAFPAPEFRGCQRAALDDIRAAFESDNDVVLVRAPTGSGKSLLARAIMGCARSKQTAEPAEPTGAYYTTPQVAQLDDVAADSLLEEFNIIRGKNNYSCLLPGEHDTPVDQAPCARKSGFDCSIKHRCPYYADRAVASAQPFAAMTLAYFMQTAGSDVFGKRDVVVIDEAHGLAEWAEMYATIELSPERVPVWDEVGVPDIDDADDPLDRTVRFAETLAGVCSRAKDDLTANPELSPEEVARRDRLNELGSELDWFVDDYRDPDSQTTWVVDQPGGEGTAITIKPLDPARYLQHTVWDRGDSFALLSATILDKTAFCRQVGLDPDRVALVDVDHTFPVENRPLYDVTQGKMTYEHRETTLPKIARLLVRLMAHHPEESGLIHAHSYSIADDLADHLTDFGVGSRVRTHTSDSRDDELAAWKASDDPEVLIAVKMEEALDLDGDLARWQVLCKAPYLNTNDSRVARRLEDDQWAWYHRTALRTVIQACGRVVRSPDDHAATYLADSSLLDLFDRAAADMPPWFQEQVDRLSKPTLPDFDPEAALAGLDGTATAPRRRSAQSSPTQSTGQTRTDAEAEQRDDHPLSDVWGDG